MVQKPRILLSLTRFLVSEGDKNLKYMRWVKRVEKLRDSVYELREAPFKLMSPLCGHCPFGRGGGGGLNPCLDGLGHFFREEFSKFKRAFA